LNIKPQPRLKNGEQFPELFAILFDRWAKPQRQITTLAISDKMGNS